MENTKTMENMIDTENKQQVMAFELIANTNSSFFLTGRAGTGKTTFLRKVQKLVNKQFITLHRQVWQPSWRVAIPSTRSSGCLWMSARQARWAR